MIDPIRRLHQLESDLRNIKQAVRERPLTGSTGGQSSATAATVFDGEVLISDVYGCRYYTGSVLADGGVTAEWDPTLAQGAQTYQPGIGMARRVDNNENVLIINDGATTEAPIDLPEQTPVVIRLSEAVQLDVIGSDPLVTVTAYPVRLL